MEMLLIIVVVLLLFGGGGYWGRRQGHWWSNIACERRLGSAQASAQIERKLGAGALTCVPQIKVTLRSAGMRALCWSLFRRLGRTSSSARRLSRSPARILSISSAATAGRC